MKAQLALALILCLLLTACRSGDVAQDIAAVEQQPTYDIVYVTLTPVPTLVPTLVRFPPTATPGTAIAAEGTPITAGNCAAALTEHYTSASDQCLAGPTGFFCNGGLPPLVEPATDALSEDAALVEADQIDRLHSRPLSAAKGGGLLWLRLEKDILMDALIVGNLNISKPRLDRNRLGALALNHHRKAARPWPTVNRCRRSARWWCKVFTVRARASSSTASPPRSTAP